MTASDLVTNADLQYAIDIRRRIHRFPELGFDLPNTSSLVKRELEQCGITCNDSYAPCSVVGYIGNGDKTIALRADMDALPVEEKNDLPFASEIAGRMHACGHDAHTAVLLTVAKILKRNENRLPVRVKLLFEPSEECETSGAKVMLDNGAIDDVDCIVCTHCDNDLQSQKIGYRLGDYMAACDPITITFYGKTAHATMPEKGVDAIAMAYQAVAEMKTIVANIAGNRDYIFSLGYFHGGTAHNVISDKCVLKISFRYYDLAMAHQIREKCLECCRTISSQAGGYFDAEWNMSAPAVHNNEGLVKVFVKSIEKIMPDKLEEIPMRKSTEDFAWFLTKKPGFLFRFGTGNVEKGCCGSAHSNDFVLDKDGMMSAILAFTQFIMDSEVVSLL